MNSNVIILIVAILAISSAWLYKNNQSKSINNNESNVEENVDKKDSPEREALSSTLISAIHTNNTKKAIEAINLGANVNKHHRKGNTALHIAAIKGNYEIASVLLNVGAEIDVENDLLQTPLHLATLNSRDTIVFLLLREGANYKLVDNNRDRAVDIATRKYDDSLIKVLRYLEY